MVLTICETTGKPLYETTDDVNHPVDYTFDAVNDFVHAPDVIFEELQCCCLGMATEIEKLRNALRLSTNGLQIITNWNISEPTKAAITTQIISNKILIE